MHTAEALLIYLRKNFLSLYVTRYVVTMSTASVICSLSDLLRVSKWQRMAQGLFESLVLPISQKCRFPRILGQFNFINFSILTKKKKPTEQKQTKTTPTKPNQVHITTDFCNDFAHKADQHKGTKIPMHGSTRNRI